jgi:carboxylesterase type B
LKWINRHISAFGGDPDKVTIWGESAGAYSVGDHINAYNGNNEGLFRAAILESGGAVGPPLNSTTWYQPMYDKIVAATGCGNQTDSLACIRKVPIETIGPLAYQGLEWFHALDGKFIPRFGQESLVTGRFAKIPIIVGTNTDEGFGVNGVNTDSDAIWQLTHSKRYVLTEPEAQEVLKRYPNDPVVGSPYGWGNRTWPEFGLQFKRFQSMATDITMFAPRRLLAQQMSKYKSNVYSYRWDAPKYNTTTSIGINHFSEVSKAWNKSYSTQTLTKSRFPLYLAIQSRILHHLVIARRISSCLAW